MKRIGRDHEEEHFCSVCLRLVTGCQCGGCWKRLLHGETHHVPCIPRGGNSVAGNSSTRIRFFPDQAPVEGAQAEVLSKPVDV